MFFESKSSSNERILTDLLVRPATETPIVCDLKHSEGFLRPYLPLPLLLALNGADRRSGDIQRSPIGEVETPIL
jgi:hypothetical protein